MARSTTETLNSYLTDLLALEEHLEVAIGAQARDLEDETRVLAPALHDIHATVEGHIAALKELIEARDAGAGNAIAEAVKRAGSVVAGLGAAAIDLVRNEKIAKDLRDDYTAFSLATVSYVMLLTTAMSLDDAQVADMAGRHLRNYARVVITLHNVIPAAVIGTLREEGLPARQDALPAIAGALDAAWHGLRAEVPEVEAVSTT